MADKPTHWHTPPDTCEKLKPLARQRRKEPSRAEANLWQLLRGKKLRDLRFRRQHTLGEFIVPFYCAEAKLVIDVRPNSTPPEEPGCARQQLLTALGLRVIRVADEDVIRSPDAVLARLAAEIDNTPW